MIIFARSIRMSKQNGGDLAKNRQELLKEVSDLLAFPAATKSQRAAQLHDGMWKVAC